MKVFATPTAVLAIMIAILGICFGFPLTGSAIGGVIAVCAMGMALFGAKSANLD